MPIVARSTPILARRINYVPRPARLFLVPRRGLGDCVLGQPSTDPNCFTTPAYIRALNLAQDTSEQKANLLPAGNDAACYDQYMSAGNFNPDAYNKCIGAQDVTSPAFNAAAAAGTPFASNPYQNVVATTPPKPPAAPPPTPPPPKPPAQSNAPAPVVVGGGSAQSNAPAPTTVKPFSIWDNPMQTLFTGNAFGIPNWWLTVGGGGLLLWFFFGRSR